MAYNTTFTENQTGFADFTEGVNTELKGVPSFAALVLIWLAVFFTARGSGADVWESFTISSFVNTLIASLLLFANFIAWYYAIIPLVMFLSGLISLFFNK